MWHKKYITRSISFRCNHIAETNKKSERKKKMRTNSKCKQITVLCHSIRIKMFYFHIRFFFALTFRAVGAFQIFFSLPLIHYPIFKYVIFCVRNSNIHMRFISIIHMYVLCPMCFCEFPYEKCRCLCCFMVLRC